MTTTSVIKVSAVVVAVAVPLGILWMQNARLRNEVRELTSESIAQTAQPLKPVSILSERSSKQAQAPASSHEETDTGKQDLKNLLASFLSPSGLLGLAESDAKSRAKRELDRIALAIPDLSEDQKEKLVALFEERNITQIQNMADLFQSGALLDRDSMTNEQRKTLAALDPRINQGVDGDRELRAILTHQQYTRFQEVENERRVKQAEFKATNTLESLSNTMDISTEQEDAIFQDLAQAQLAEEPAADEDRDPFDAMRAREEAQEAIIRSHLTEEQLTAYDEQISQDKGRREAMEKMFRSIFSKQDEE
jgi:hypothetical protein